MTVFVDELQHWPGALSPFHKGFCHLTATSDEELHAFAFRIGLRRSWFQPHRVANHYDLTPRRREAALAMGAVFMPAREQIVRRRAGTFSAPYPHQGGNDAKKPG